MALPYGMLFQFGSTFPTGNRIDQIDASVAPPRLTTFTLGSTRRIWSGKPSGIQSPLIMTSRKESPRSSGFPGLIHEQLQQRGHCIPEGDPFRKN